MFRISNLPVLIALAVGAGGAPDAHPAAAIVTAARAAASARGPAPALAARVTRALA